MLIYQEIHANLLESNGSSKYAEIKRTKCKSGGNMAPLNGISQELDFCSACKTDYLRPIGEIVAKGESAVDLQISVIRRVLKCDKCKQRQVLVARKEYVITGDDVKTKFT